MTVARDRAQPFHVVFAGGGSGGHLTPSIAVAEKLLIRRPDARVTFLTSGRDIDRVVLQHSSMACDERCRIVPLSLTQPPGLSWAGVLHGWSLGASALKCRRILKQMPADVMLATGAFASVPALLLAKRLKIPTVLFEANAVSGKVNRWWSQYASVNLSGWPPSNSESKSAFEYVGLPVRLSDGSANEADVSRPRSDSQQILILGGSQGSQRLNELVNSTLSMMELPVGWSVLHQIGSNGSARPPEGHESNAVRTVPFIGDLVHEMSRSAFVIGRAGAVTLGELAATGCPAVLVPLSSAADDHQRQNAEYFKERGATVLVDETAATVVDDLADAINRMISDQNLRNAMSKAAGLLHRANAADEIARRLVEVTELI
jgi:UDP-N-acetylglucosamine--N-acetylmuramyl-(pentapeptide) pyrophosphoryl-undecaprenol N-acetylglucosamine transferase